MAICLVGAKMKNQLQVQDVVLLTIKRIGINGEGIGFYKRQAVFVDGGLPGEIVEVRITEAKESYVVGTITKMKKASPDRIEPVCPYFQKCGGCQLQHLSYSSQLKEKKNMVLEAFDRYYDGDIKKLTIYDPLGMQHPWNYRNKSSLPVRHDGSQVVVGMYSKHSNHLAFISKCPIENETIEKARTLILSRLSKENVSIYNPKTKQGALRYLVIRSFNVQDEVQVTFVLYREDKKAIQVLKSLPFSSLNYSINNDPKSIEIFGKEVICVKGNAYIEGNLNHLTFKISPTAFFQLNTKQTLVLYEQIKKACELTGKEKIIDGYCGIGSIGMYLASEASEVRGIDNNQEGIEDAKKFAKMNHLNHVHFYHGNILPHLQQFQEKGFIPDILILDPPRTGLDINLIHYLQKNVISKIIYVSCNLSTLAKNLNHLQRQYYIQYIQPIDMFPQTSHVETVVLLSSRKNHSKEVYHF